MTIRRRIKNVYQPVISQAAWLWRAGLANVNRIGVTGSVGKTTTKDLIAAVLGSQLTGSVSYSTTNTDYSIARTFLRTRPWHDYCVQELGASGPGTLDSMLKAFQPNIGVLTHVGEDHYTAFRGREGVAKEKGKLLLALPKNGLAVINADDSYVMAMPTPDSVRRISFGRSEDADIRAINVNADFPDTLSFDVMSKESSGSAVQVCTSLFGEHMLYPTLAALAVGLQLGVTLEQGVQAIRRQVPENGRMRHYQSPAGVHFIDDSIKAPYWSLDATFDYIQAARAATKWLVIGSVSDTSTNAKALSRRVARRALESADRVVLVGKHTKYVEASDRLRVFQKIADANEFLRKNLSAGDLVLLKGGYKQDHLVRLVLSHLATVNCWDDSCRKDIHCTVCPRLS